MKAIQLWFVPPFSCCIDMRQRLCKHRESCFWLPNNTVCFGEERQKIGPLYFCARGSKGSQALLDLRDAFLRLSLLRHCPATQNSTLRHPGREPLFLSKLHGGFRTLLHCTHLAAILLEHASPAQGKTEAKGVSTVLRQGHCFLAPRQRLGRIPQRPQRPGGKTVTHHTSVFPITERRGTVLLGLVECYTLCQMRVRCGNCAQDEQRRPYRTMRSTKHGSIAHLLRPSEELFAQCVCHLVLGTHEMIIPESTQQGEELVGVFQMLAELPSVRVRLSHSGGAKALHGYE